jgi:hypothetical protein
MTDLEKAIKQRDDFLKAYPEMLEYQKTIDATLNEVPEKDRLEVLFIMIAGNMIKIENKLKELRNC